MSRLAARATPKSVMRALPSTPTSTFCGEHVAVHEAEQLAAIVAQLVRGVQAGERVEHDAHDHVARRHLPGDIARATMRDERVALDVLHHQVVAPLGLADLEDGDDVGVMDARGEPRLVEEHLDELGLVRRGAGAGA